MIKKVLWMLASSIVAGAFAAPVKVEDKSKLLYLEYIEGAKQAGIATSYKASDATSVKFKGAFMENVAYSRLFADSKGESYDTCRVIAKSPAKDGIYLNCSWKQGNAYGFNLSAVGQIFEGLITFTGLASACFWITICAPWIPLIYDS